MVRAEAMIAAFEASPPLRLAVLFGSMARGTQRPESDVDIAILPADAAFSLREELDLQARLAKAVGREVDLVRLDNCTPALGFRIAQEGVLLVGDVVDWKRYQARAAIEHAELAPQLKRAADAFQARLQSPVRTEIRK